MRITATRDDLAAAVKSASIAMASGAQTISALTHLRLSANGRCEVFAHGLERSSAAPVVAEIAREGERLLPAAPFQSILNGSAKGSHVEIDASDVSAVIKIGRSRYTLPVLASELLPRGLQDEPQATIRMPGDALVRMLAAVEPAMAERTRINLAGVFLRWSEDTLAALAADGRRMHRVVAASADIDGEMPLNGGADGQRGVLLPDHAVKDIRKFGGGGGDILIEVSDRLLTVRREGASYTTKLVDQVFPTYERYIPVIPESRARVDRAELLGACDRLVSITNKLTGCRANITWSDEGELTLASRGGLDGNADGTETMPSECSGEGNPTVNVNYLRDALNATTGEFVEICHTVGGQHIFILDPSDAGFTAVIMSLR